MIPRPLRLALAPIRSAIVLARFVFLKTTSKTPIPHSKSLPVPPLAAPGVILEVESPQKVAIRIASRLPPASRPEEGEEMTQSAQCRGLRPLHAHSIAFDTERDPRASCAISDGLP